MRGDPSDWAIPPAESVLPSHAERFALSVWYEEARADTPATHGGEAVSMDIGESSSEAGGDAPDEAAGPSSQKRVRSPTRFSKSEAAASDDAPVDVADAPASPPYDAGGANRPRVHVHVHIGGCDSCGAPCHSAHSEVTLVRWYRERACGKWLCVACAAEPRPSLAVTPCMLCGGTHLIDRIPFLGIPRSAAAEGWTGLYRGLGITLIRGIPNTGIQFLVYETLKDVLDAYG